MTTVRLVLTPEYIGVDRADGLRLRVSQSKPK